MKNILVLSDSYDHTSTCDLFIEDSPSEEFLDCLESNAPIIIIRMAGKLNFDTAKPYCIWANMAGYEIHLETWFHTELTREILEKLGIETF
jgi:hypothetical protein